MSLPSTATLGPYMYMLVIQLFSGFSTDLCDWKYSGILPFQRAAGSRQFSQRLGVA